MSQDHTTTEGAAADGAPVLPLQLLQPLDASQPLSTSSGTGDPEQRLIVSTDPAVAGSDGSWLPPSQLLISKDGESRSIWPVHLAGWQALGWQLLSPVDAPNTAPPSEEAVVLPEQVLDPDPLPAAEAKPAPDPDPVLEPEPDLEPDLELEAEPVPEQQEPVDDAAGGEALLAAETTDFQAMTKAQIVEYCSAMYGVELDGSQTKAELIEQATTLEVQATAGSTAADLAALELGDGLL